MKKLELTLISSDWRRGDEFREKLNGLYDIELITSLEQYTLVSPASMVLVEMNCAKVKLISEIASSNTGTIIVFYQVQKIEDIVNYLCVQGVNGMFMVNDGIEVIQKGLLALHRNELFFPRSITNILLQKIKLDTNHSAIEISRLSKKEQQILRTLSQGMTNNDIAKEMNLSFHTVKTHVYNIYKKLNINNRSEATKIAQSVFI